MTIIVTVLLGYENQDWFIPSPALKPEEVPSPLTPEQIRETFNYFRKSEYYLHERFKHCHMQQLIFGVFKSLIPAVLLTFIKNLS